MSTLVSTGQITIVDNNDARPITAYITNGTIPLQQVYNKDTGTPFVPDRTTQNLILSAKVYIGSTSGGTPIETLLSNPKWSYDLSTALTTNSDLTVVATQGSAPTLTIKTNNLATTANPNQVIYFSGDYTDTVTGLVSHIVCQTALSLVQTGSNAVYVQLVGNTNIEQGTGTAKKQTYIKADLMRASGIDTDNLTYKWYTLPSGSPVDQTLTGWASRYGFRTATQSATDDLTNPTSAMLGVGVPATVAASTVDGQKSIVIDETAIQNYGFYRCDIYDSVDAKTYSGYFTIRDTSDPYSTTLISTTGDKLQNGQGSTDVYPVIYYGANKVTDLSGWSFSWNFYDGVTGFEAGFIDTTRTALAGGRLIMSNTAGATSVISYSTTSTPNTGTPIAFVAGDLVKLVTPAGVAKYYEVASGTTNTNLTLRAATAITWLSGFAAPGLNEFGNGTNFGRLFVCTGNGVAAGYRTTTGANNNDQAAKITVTGDEIDGKGIITCAATRP